MLVFFQRQKKKSSSQKSHPRQTLPAECGKSFKENMAEKLTVFKLNCTARHQALSFEYLQLSSDEKNFKHSSKSAVQSKHGHFFPPLRPRRGVCNSVCFHLPWYEASCRPELCVWQWGRSAELSRPGPALGTWGWTEAICWGVWGCPQGKERGEKSGVRFGVIGYSGVYMCWEGRVKAVLVRLIVRKEMLC